MTDMAPPRPEGRHPPAPAGEDVAGPGSDPGRLEIVVDTDAARAAVRALGAAGRPTAVWVGLDDDPERAEFAAELEARR